MIPRDMTPAEFKLQNSSHNLQALWDAFKSIDAEAMSRFDSQAAAPEDMEGIEAYIGQLTAIDEGSITFRYPLTKDGPVTFGTVERINLARFSEYMERLCNYLDGVESYYDAMMDAWHDMMKDCC